MPDSFARLIQSSKCSRFSRAQHLTKRRCYLIGLLDGGISLAQALKQGDLLGTALLFLREKQPGSLERGQGGAAPLSVRLIKGRRCGLAKLGGLARFPPQLPQKALYTPERVP